jgi:hypothetical protein
MAVGKIFDILETIYLVKLLTNYIRFDLKFRGFYLYHVANSAPEYATRWHPDITFHAFRRCDIGKNG